MTFEQADGIRYLTFNSLAAASVRHAVFTRRGGVSPDPWRGLNVGGTVGDEPQRVVENRQRAFLALERDPNSLYDVWQVHGRAVVRADAPRPLDQPHLKADAILTDRPQVSLFMRFADCVPILLYDPQQRVVGLVHAGWQGTVKRVAAGAIEAMQSWYNSRAQDILAAIGPSIAAHHYPVGDEVVAQVRQAFGAQAEALLANGGAGEQPDRLRLDLWAANRLVLEQVGVRSVEVAGICTACAPQDWFSHRGEAGKTGRFGALIALEH